MTGPAPFVDPGTIDGMCRCVSVLATLCLLLAGAPPVCAQDQPASPPDTSGQAVPDPPADGAPVPVTSAKDVGDLWRYVRHKHLSPDAASAAQSAKKPFFFASPSFSSKPSTGFSAGVATSLVFIAGDPAVTHISSADWSMNASVLKQAGTGLRFRVYTPGNRWFIQADNRLAWTSQNTYGLGIEQDATAERLKYDRFRVYDTAFRQITPTFFVGGGLNVNDHSNMRAASGSAAAFQNSAFAAYSLEHGYAIDHQVSSGVNVGMIVDTRDSPINASRGWLAATTFRTFFDGFLGGSSTWQMLDVDVRTYKSFRPNGRQKIGVWLIGDLVTGGTPPYFDLPGIGEDTYGRSARGYTTGRFRGPHLLYGELEYRATLSANGFWGAVAFANTTVLDGEDQKLFSSAAPAAGGGLRVLLSKRSKTNLCVDYGIGTHGSSGLYLAVRETF